jgi:hypothetical protein
VREHRLPHPAKVIGIGSVIYGAGMAAGPDAGFRAASYATAYELVERRVWGAAFLLAGLAVVLRLSVRSAMALAGVLGMWAAAIGFEVGWQIIREGETSSIVAPTWSTTAALTMLAIVEWFGLDDG